MRFNCCPDWSFVFLQALSQNHGQPLDKAVGNLLYYLATKIVAQIAAHRSLLIEYIATKKLASELQLKGALEVCRFDIPFYNNIYWFIFHQMDLHFIFMNNEMAVFGWI